MTKSADNACEEALNKTAIFSYCLPSTVQLICSQMERKQFKRGDILYRQGDAQNEMLLVTEGRIDRERDIGGQTHMGQPLLPGNAFGGNHVLRQDKCTSTLKCATDVVAYTLNSEDFNKSLEKPQVAREVVYSLQKEIRRQANLLQTPLLEQHPKPTPYFATSVAAGLESFYRSALNASLNAKLTGQPATSLFPNMGVQVPTRVLYINGFKGIRHVLDSSVDPERYEYPGMTRLGMALAPGILMTPISSILEACNAAHMNAEPLQIRWIRGLIPRGFREIIFGLGLNQLTDYFEERIPSTVSPAIKNAGGSLMAGVVAGYFSHVPHNLSTLKLMSPQVSYTQLVKELIQRSESRVPTSFSPSTRRVIATGLALLVPRGLGIRTTQIVGSFMILNGTINSLKDFDPRRYLPSSLMA